MFLRSYIEVDEDVYRRNIRVLKEVSGKTLFMVIKANAYGLGDEEAVRIGLEEGIDHFAVSSLDEALRIRRFLTAGTILILGYVDKDDLEEVRKNSLSIVTVSKDYVKDCGERLQGIKIHLKLNTGMNRIGVRPEEAKETLDLLLSYGADIEGIMTHFVSSDDDEDYTHHQAEVFKECLDSLNYDFKYIHTSNSDGTIHFPDDFTNAVRPGIALLGHGSYPSELRPCMSLYTQVVSAKKIPKGETVSYGRHFTADEDTYIMTLPIGYADGFYRSNTGKEVYIDGEYAKIVGSVCMDQMMIQTKKLYPVGTRVEIFGEHIDIEKRAKELGTIVYELYTSLSERLTRVYKKSGQTVRIVRPRFD